MSALEAVVVDVVLEHPADAVDALEAVAQGAGRADVQDPGRAPLGERRAATDGRRRHLADAGEQHVDAGEVGRLLAHAPRRRAGGRPPATRR